MLNELLIVERGLRQAGIEMVQGHPDVHDCRRMPTLLVRLDKGGRVESVRPLPQEVTPWTLRDGQHNSFPFVQPKPPFWTVADGDGSRGRVLEKKGPERRSVLLDLAKEERFNADAFADWPGRGLLDRLQERRRQLAPLEDAEATVVPETIDRFLVACSTSAVGSAAQLFRGIADELVKGLQQSAQSVWLEVAVALLIGTCDKKKEQWKCHGALFFEAADAEVAIVDRRTASRVCEVLRQGEGSAEAEGQKIGTCALTSWQMPLVSGNFPQPNLPILGQTYLFAKNRDISANDRYGRFSADAMPVGMDTAIRLAAAVEALTAEDRRGITWRTIPGETPKQSDLLLAFVDQTLDAPAAGVLVEDDSEDDFSQESSQPLRCDEADSVAVFEKRTERVIEAVKAKVKNDFRSTPVRVMVFRKVDQANRKVVYAGAPTVGDLYDAAKNWVAGEHNVPPGLTLPVLRNGERKPRPMSPPHLAPLGVIAFSKRLFLRGGTERQEVIGLPAAEVLGLFLDLIEIGNCPARRRAHYVRYA